MVGLQVSRKVQLSIAGRGPETDAPSVDDLLDQIRDYFDVLASVEESVAEDGQSAIEWRVIGASKASPLSITAQAFPRQFGVNVDRRADLVVSAAICGLAKLQTTAERPAHFSEVALRKAENIFARVLNGLDSTTILAGDDLPAIDLTPAVAREAAAHTRAILTPTNKPHKELGSVEGSFKSVSRDGWGRAFVLMTHRLTGDELKCFLEGDAERQIETHQIREVLKGRRIQVFGTIHYRSVGRISHVNGGVVRFLRGRSELPDVDDIHDPEFTGGMRSEDYLDKVRNGEGT